ncbi:MAG: phosphonate C-P lyase system protein PhnH [Acidisphaera sp.]|nr:phosphonate C-P lyase system protein PhnH [Acidisphaera sp.]
MSLDLPGFADPVAQAQGCFRAVLNALSRPGRLCEAGAGLTPPTPLDAATGAVLLTLLDGDTTLWLDAACGAAREWLAFHTGAPVCAAPADADFLLCRDLPDLAGVQAGSDEAPEDGATVILQVPALGRGRAMRLFGPGLRDPAELRVDGLPAGFASSWQANHARFPLGVDLILCAGTRLAALPRSVAVESL